MLRSRFLGFCVGNRSRVSSLTPLGEGLCPFQKFQTQGYAKETNHRGYRLVEPLQEADEALHSHSWGRFVIPPAILMIVGACAYLHYNDEKRAILKGSQQDKGPERSNFNRPAIGGPFRLVDTENRLVTESDLRGNWILMYFGYTSSPDVGPAEVQKMAKVIDVLESDHNLMITPVYITIDPQRDSPGELKAYLKEFDPRIVGLTGPIAAIRQIAQEYRVYFKKVDEEGQDYLIESSNNMYLLDPNMEISRCLGPEYDEVQLADVILKEVKKASK